jgi:magnesium chelatase family protein
MLATAHSFALVGIEALPVRVEVEVADGYPQFQIVGLPAASVRESRERIASAIRNSGYRLPIAKITVNLAPAGIPKAGTSLDLPVALAVLGALGELPAGDLQRTWIVGELSLDGAVRPVRGVLSMALRASQESGWRLLVPRANLLEAGAVRGLRLRGASRLRDVAGMLADGDWDRSRGENRPPAADRPRHCLSQIRGQALAKRALEVAAAGGHHLLMVGPPGTGKTLLARRLPGILPPLTLRESLEVTRVHSVAGQLGPDAGLIWERPFRSPHHTASAAGLAGGGRPVLPGEISLAHRGVLFLDELPEFPRSVLEILRQPLEEGSLTVVRAGLSLRFPARFTLVASMNPCPCGHEGNPHRPCRCTEAERQRYRRRVSGPLLDRFDLHVGVPQVEVETLEGARGEGETSSTVRGRVLAARRLQAGRLGGDRCNAELGPEETQRWCAPDEEGRILLRKAFRSLALSARSYHRILRVARTLADLEGSREVRAHHVSEALQLRILDRPAR